MNLRLGLTICLRWWWLILLPALAAGGYALVTRPQPSTTYATTLRFTASQAVWPVTAPAPEGYDPAHYRWLTSEYIVGGLKDWVNSPVFAEAVRAELAAGGLELPGGALAGRFGADNTRSLLIVFINWGDAAQLQRIVQATATVLQTQNAAIFPQLGGQTAPVTPLVTVTPPEAVYVAPVGASLRTKLDLPLKAGLGLVVGLGLAFLAHFFDPALREKRELEDLGLAVMAEIPPGRRPKP